MRKPCAASMGFSLSLTFVLTRDGLREPRAAHRWAQRVRSGASGCASRLQRTVGHSCTAAIALIP